MNNILTVFYDKQDPQNEGYAYHLESGEKGDFDLIDSGECSDICPEDKDLLQDAVTKACLIVGIDFNDIAWDDVDGNIAIGRWKS